MRTVSERSQIADSDLENKCSQKKRARRLAFYLLMLVGRYPISSFQFSR
ncbi:MAG: hypothetical protein JWO13_1288 [Acidobacteriales bacterium]|nr:hypothetical protein [Terriglobales bacterium]